MTELTSGQNPIVSKILGFGNKQLLVSRIYNGYHYPLSLSEVGHCFVVKVIFFDKTPGYN